MLKIYIDEERIKSRVKSIAKEIEKEIGDKEVVFISNLKGSIIFFADIIRHIKSTNIVIDFIATESYSGRKSTGEIKILKDISLDLSGRDIILIEDILDTGLTLQTLINYIKEVHKPSSIKTVILLDKPSRRIVDLKVDYTGFVIEDVFVVGYGMDYDERYRNLPYIAILE
ncbi:MAG: hypoxanthine phosphoribosyltransferase [Brevinematia bacterium]